MSSTFFVSVNVLRDNENFVRIPDLRHRTIQRAPNRACLSRACVHCVYTASIRHKIHCFDMILFCKATPKDVLICELYNITPIYNPFFVRVCTCVCVCVCE
jgi:hypothetical protein